jgi:hypothetical protein
MKLDYAIHRAWELADVYKDVVNAHSSGLRPRGDQLDVFEPPEGMIPLHNRVYASHVRELLDRVASDNPLSFATKAEVLVALMRMSLTAPLNRNAQVLYERLFLEIMGKLPPGISEAAPMTEMYAGAADDLLIEMKKKYRKDDRKWPPST